MDWKAAKKEYLAGGISLRALAKKYGTNYSAAARRSKRWVEARDQVAAKTTSKAIEAISTKAADARSELYNTAEIVLGIVKEKAQSGQGNIKEITGALRDLKIVLDLKGDDDKLEQRARIEKLRREAEEAKNTAQSIHITVEGAEGWTD